MLTHVPDFLKSEIPAVVTVSFRFPNFLGSGVDVFNESEPPQVTLKHQVSSPRPNRYGR